MTDMSKLIRNGSYVEIRQQGFVVKCSVPYGAAPLEMYNTDVLGAPILVTNSPAGEGFQCLIDTGQDFTQASSNGQDANPMLSLAVPYIPGSSYWGREEAFIQDQDGREACYQVSGKAPYFWASLEKEDDFYPFDARGDHGWSTQYHDLLNLGPSGYGQIGTPIFFKYTPQVPSGIILIGDELAQGGGKIPARIPGGHLAGKCSISLRHAQNAVAAIWFGIEETAFDIDSVYNAPKCGIYVNSAGSIAFHDGAKVSPLPGNYTAAVNSEDGVRIEWRDYATTIDIRINGVLVANLSKSHFGPYAGLFTTGTSGYAKIHYRDLFDAGTEFVQTLRTTKRNTLITDYQIFRTMAPWGVPTYRTNLPVAFVHPSLRESVQLWDVMGEQLPLGDGWDYLSGIDTIYAGRADGSAGLMCRPLSYSGEWAHAGYSTAHIALSALPHGANNDPVMTRHTSIISEWAPKLRRELIAGDHV